MIEQEEAIWMVMSNSDLTEGRGYPVYLHHCKSQMTARRLSRGKGVQGTDADLIQSAAYQIDGQWYGRIRLEMITTEDANQDRINGQIAAARKKAAAAGLTQEDIDLLSS